MITETRRIRVLQVSVLCAAMGCLSVASAGAFQNWEQTAYGTGDYHAGAAAEADDASLEFYNPAQITHLKHQEISAGGVIIPVDIRFDGTVNNIPAPNPVSSITLNAIPNFHYVVPLSQQWYFAFGVTTPFGLETDYPDNYPVTVSYAATKTKLTTVNLNPNIAYKVNQYLSLAVGFDTLYGDAVYDNNIFGTGLFKNNLDGWAFGYNAGVFLEFPHGTRIGASYRSAMTIDGSGESKYAGARTTVSADFPLPATTMFTVYQQVNPRWAVMGSVFYTQWSCFTNLLLKNTAAFKDIPVAENYRNTWNVALGTKVWMIKNKLALELGGGYDQTPTRTGYRDIRLPDVNHYAVSTGLQWRASKSLSLDVGYTHLMAPHADIDNTASAASSNNEVPTQVGTAKSSVNVFGLQLTLSL